SGGQRGQVHLVLVGSRRRDRGLVGSDLVRSHLVGERLFGRETFLLGGSGLILGHLLGLLGSDTRLLGGPGVGLGPCLLGFLRTLGGKARALLFGQPRFFGGGDARFLGGD